MIRFPYVNWTEYWPVHNALFKDLFLKTRKYYDKHYYRKFVGLEQDMQSLAGRRRPFGTPLPTRPCVIRVTFTQWLNSFITRLTRWYLWKSFYPKYKSLWIPCWSRCLYLLFKERVNAASLKPSLPVSWTKIQLSRIEIPGENVFSANSILIGPRSTDELRGKRTPDSSSPRLKTFWEPFSDEIQMYRLPSNHSGPRETDRRFEFPTSNYPRKTPFRGNPGVSVA